MRLRLAALVLTCSAAASPVILAQAQAPATYLTPPPAIVDIMNAEPLPTVAVSPSKDVIALMPRASMPDIAELSQPMLRLGGLRINPRTNGPHNAPSGIGLTLRTVATGAERKVTVPAGARIGNIKFSPDGKRLAFTNTRDTAIDLYVADVATGQSRVIAGSSVNGLSNACEWLNDSTAMLCAFVPGGRKGAPAEPTAPVGPNIQENTGKPGPVRTYQDLLTSAHDEALFEYCLQSQLALVDTASG